MIVVRTKVIAILIGCAISILLISSYLINGSLRVKTCGKCQKKAKDNPNINEANSEPLHYENPQYYYNYEIFEKEIMAYDKDGSITTEIEDEPQNYNVRNEIEYVDYMNSTELTDMKQADPNIISLKQLFNVCIKAAKAGGVQLQSVRRNFDLKEIWKMKPANSSDNPVSVGRTLSHQAMMYILKKYFPNIQLVSRKLNGYTIDPYDEDFQPRTTSDDVLVPSKNVLVWFDPLDPEHEYFNNFLEYVTTAICVAVKGKPIIGIIHQPFENFTKWGWVDHGLSNDPYPVASEPVDVSRPLSIILSTVGATHVKVMARLALGVHFDAFAVNGAGYKIIQLTEERADGYLHVNGIKKWKICAGDAIIKAAGGVMTTMHGKEIDYGDPSRFINDRGIIASIVNPHLFEDLGPFESKVNGPK
ncbi:unnamed protein product [Larinioides sclopetarius]|uniref:inositol-phosphate phosphatase n=1 Tax=Larinioides sclopetarius TaxID=280406 RepID=A0AAV1ZKI3_9ARAC